VGLHAWTGTRATSNSHGFIRFACESGRIGAAGSISLEQRGRRARLAEHHQSLDGRTTGNGRFSAWLGYVWLAPSANERFAPWSTDDHANDANQHKWRL